MAVDHIAWANEVRRLAKERDALIIAHNYQVPQIQDIADHVGDSLYLSRIAATAPHSEIVFCGVHFMAETAKILSPDKRVLLPDAEAGCSLADTITADQLRAWRAEHPGAAVVAYVNTSAAVKAETDICCTSSNAADVIRTIPADQDILFLPDRHLGEHVRRMTGRDNIHLWQGQCHVHEGITPTKLLGALADNPDADVLVHPECACANTALSLVGSGQIASERVRITSTGGMTTIAGGRPGTRTVLVATETGMLHQLRKLSPTTRWEPVDDDAICPYMKMTDADALLHSLRTGTVEIGVDPVIADRARASVEKMIAIGSPSRGGE